MSLRIERVLRGARIVQNDCVLSEILRQPGATNCLFDVLAMSIRVLSPGPAVLLLGFAGGGVVAPLRASGWHHPLVAVDLDLAGEGIFRELSDGWCGEVLVEEGEAANWLRSRPRARYDLILEDLSVALAGEITKPEVSLETLPQLMPQSLAPGGVVVTNVLPVPGWSRRQLLTLLAAPHPRAVVVSFEDWENLLLLSGSTLPSARELSRTLRAALGDLGSDQGRRLAVSTFR